MTRAELGFGILIKVIALLVIIAIITIVITKINSKTINQIQNIYLGKLENSDESIQDAMQYLGLTNGIKQQLNRKNPSKHDC